MSTRFETSLKDVILPWGILPSEEQFLQLRNYFGAVLETNAQINLTRITDPAEAAIKLFADSLSVVAWAEKKQLSIRHMIDGGTGAGFPAAPVAILHPNWKIDAVDSTAKKINFVDQAASALGITNLKASHTRIEYLRPEPRYDLVTFKAVGPIASCLRWAQHVVAFDGHVILFKTTDLTKEEEQQGQETARRVGYTEVDPYEYTLHWADETMYRVLRIFRRTG